MSASAVTSSDEDLVVDTIDGSSLSDEVQIDSVNKGVMEDDGQEPLEGDVVGNITESAPDVITDAATDATKDAKIEVTSEIANESTADVTADVTTDAATDITTEGQVANDLTTDVTTSQSTSVMPTEPTPQLAISTQPYPPTNTPKLSSSPSFTSSPTPASPTAATATPWNYLRRAVANVESTLDKVLQESTEVGVNKPTTPTNSTSNAKLSMQERLAMAVGRSSSSTPPAQSGSSRPSSERNSIDRSRKSVESVNSVVSTAATTIDVTSSSNEETTTIKTLQPRTTNVEQPSLDLCIKLSKQLVDMLTLLHISDEKETITESEDDKSAKTALEKSITLLANDIEVQNRHLQEFNTYQQEKLEVAESKLMYLAKSEADRAKKAKSSSSGTNRTIAEKEEYIALLLEEGQMLSKQELKHMNTIKKLRARDRDSDKTFEMITRRAEKAEKELSDTKLKLKKSIETEKRQSENIKGYSKLELEVLALRKDKELLTSKVSQLEANINKLNIQHDANAAKAKEEALDSANAKLEKLQVQYDETYDKLTLQIDRKSGEIDALKVQIQREVENSSRKESTLRDEIKNLEARVEHYRALSEDASTDSSKEIVHMNLLRQIETLQSQHSVASENWHEIEASLLGRISTFEKELEKSKNEEKYLVKRLKTISDSLKRQSEETDDVREQLSDLEESLAKTKKELQKEINEKKDLEESKISYEHSMEAEKSEYKNEIAELKEKLKTVTEELATAIEVNNSSIPTTSGLMSPTHNHSFIDPMSSPMIPGYAGGGLNNEKKRSVSNSLDAFLIGGTQGNGITSPLPYSPSPDVQIRRASSSARIFSGPNNRSESIVSNGLDLPSMDENDDFFDDSVTQDGGYTSGGIDNNSLYTTSGGGGGGGVSLQLVGKMNMTIRRLESDLANCRQDLTKISKAKDDAYQEVIRLMKDNEELNILKENNVKLEAKVQEHEAREQTTLEMLGEKSELVQELRADVEDLKTMYRQQIEELVDQLHKK